MTAYNDEKNRSSRTEFTQVNLLLDRNNTDGGFGTGDTSINSFKNDANSYDTPVTTSSSNAFNPDQPKKIYAFSSQIHAENGEFDDVGIMFPILKNVALTQPIVKPGISIGARAKITVSFDDMETDDIFELRPPYENKRVTGSFWGKLIARNILLNRVIEVERGYFNDGGYPVTEKETYVITDVQRTKNGGCTITGTDMLYYANEVKAKVPLSSAGKLTTQITLTQTTIDVSGSVQGEYDFELDAFGVPKTFGHVNIGNEIVKYTGVTYPTSTTSQLTGCTRAQFNSIAKGSSEDTLVQVCFVRELYNVVDVIRDILVRYTKIDLNFIDSALWDAEKAVGEPLEPYNLTTVIPKPKSVKKVIDELIQTSGATMFFDTVKNKLALFGVAEFENPVFTFEEDINVQQDSVQITLNTNDQTTRRAIDYAKFDYTQNDDDRNFLRGIPFIDDLNERPEAFDAISEAKTIKNNWLDASTLSDSLALGIVERDVLRKTDIPFTVKMTIDEKHIGDLQNGKRMWLGSVFELITSKAINPDGTPLSIRAQVTQLKKRKDSLWDVTGIKYSAHVLVEDEFDYILDSGDSGTDLIIESIAPDLPGLGRPVRVLIKTGFEACSSSTSAYALKTGVYANGLDLYMRGASFGAGGKGGDATEVPPEMEPGFCFVGFGDTKGKNGGNSLLIECNTVLDVTGGGQIYAGGGGGAAGDSWFYDNLNNNPITVVHFGNGGGGAQGCIPGLGGLGASPNGTDGTDGTKDAIGTGAGDGGAWGSDGESYSEYKCGETNRFETTPGGLSGTAIVHSGFCLQILGQSSFSIKGAIVG